MTKDEGSSGFFYGIARKVGSDLHTCFWEDHGLGSIPLKHKYPSLFSNYLKPERLAGEIREVINMVLTCDFRWRISFFLREFPVILEFHVLLRDVILTLDKDKLIWKNS